MGDEKVHMQQLLAQTARAAGEHLESISHRSVAPTSSALEALHELLQVPLPVSGRAPSAILEELAGIGGPAMHMATGGRYFGFVTGGTLPAAMVADMLAAAWDQNGWNEATSPGAAAFERHAIAGLLRLLRLPMEAVGALCSGCTGANIIALTCARDAVLSAVGWDVESDGLIGAPPIAVYAGEEAHSSVFKALGIVGLGRGGHGKHVTRLACNALGAIEASAVENLAPPVAPAIICLQAGHVNTGTPIVMFMTSHCF